MPNARPFTCHTHTAHTRATQATAPTTSTNHEHPPPNSNSYPTYTYAHSLNLTTHTYIYIHIYWRSVFESVLWGQVLDVSVSVTLRVSGYTVGVNRWYTWGMSWVLCLFLPYIPQSERCSVVSDSLQPHGLYSPWNSPGQNTGVGSLSLLQGIFPTQGLNPGLPHCRQILYQLSHKGSPRILE